MKDLNITKDPLSKVFKRLAIPASIGMFFQTMYNVVDTFYAGQISTEALAALSISFPVFFIILALSMGISQGSSALIANELGAKKKKLADAYSSQTLVAAVFIGIIITLLSLLVVRPLFSLLGAEGVYLQYALDYMRIILLGTPIFVLSFAVNGTLSAVGDMKTVRNGLIAGFLLNIILDPWFLYGGFGLPAMGIKGIALATICTETISLIYRFLVMKGYVKKFDFKLKWDLLKNLFHQAYPISLNRLLVSAGIFIITYFVSQFGATAVAAYGIAVRVEQIMLLPSVGLGVATLTLVGQNNGAKKFDRVKAAYFRGLKYGLYISIVGGILILLLGKYLMKLFTEDPEVISIGSTYLNIAAFLLFFYISTFATVSFYQGLKKPLVSLWIGISRQIILPIILFPIGASLFGILGIWIGIALTIVLASIILLIMGFRKANTLV